VARHVAILFPGQASQQVGMGRLACERCPEARAVFQRIDDALGIPISATCFEGPADRLQETSWQQPAVFACSMALYEAWRSTGDATVVAAAGHSLGEYGALVAAGALTLEGAAMLVALRGRLMQAAARSVPGGMCAVQGLDRAAVAAICEEASRLRGGLAEIVVLANDNAPDQQVISGGLSALERGAQLARERGARRVIPLRVAGAFHSPLMEPAVHELAEAVARVPMQGCGFPVLANCTALPTGGPDDIRAELIRQVTSPVCWVDSLHALAALGPDLWVDTGPGKVVAGLAARTLPGIELLSLSALFDSETPDGQVGRSKALR